LKLPALPTYSSQLRFKKIVKIYLVEQVPASKAFNFLEHRAGTDGCSRVEPASAQYRKFADECRRLARFVQTAEERRVLQEMEAAWTNVAEEVERKAGKSGI
jgi:hypothetical protein